MFAFSVTFMIEIVLEIWGLVATYSGINYERKKMLLHNGFMYKLISENMLVENTDVI